MLLEGKIKSARIGPTSKDSSLDSDVWSRWLSSRSARIEGNGNIEVSIASFGSSPRDFDDSGQPEPSSLIAEQPKNVDMVIPSADSNEPSSSQALSSAIDAAEELPQAAQVDGILAHTLDLDAGTMEKCPSSEVQLQDSHGSSCDVSADGSAYEARASTTFMAADIPAKSWDIKSLKKKLLNSHDDRLHPLGRWLEHRYFTKRGKPLGMMPADSLMGDLTDTEMQAALRYCDCFDDEVLNVPLYRRCC